jgi:hypothetical protein
MSKPIHYAIIVLGVALQGTAPVLANQSIVGTWANSRGECGSHFGRMEVGPKSLSISEELACDFRSVERQGDTVTWKGACTFFGSGDNAQRRNAKVVATLRSDRRLDVRVAGGLSIARGYQRCGR